MTPFVVSATTRPSGSVTVTRHPSVWYSPRIEIATSRTRSSRSGSRRSRVVSPESAVTWCSRARASERCSATLEIAALETRATATKIPSTTTSSAFETRKV